MITGDTIGPFTILGKLGEGGMGEVYRARDSKLKREVAIKVLPADVANDRERLARFQREAEVLASLNHPNIAQVFGIENPPEGGQHSAALVMELVEGEDLSQRISRGPIPLDEALPIAQQIAEGLEAAHGAGIVHRDLKPANIKVREDGTVKVLDFGLAKALEAEDAKASSLQTITTPAMTVRGVILGTAAYMSPEQAKGRVVDRRADMWAFGCVLYEMLTGTRAFDGEDVTEILGAIVKTEPDWTKLPVDTPAVIRTLLSRCLRKKASERIDSAAVARFDIADASTAVAPPRADASTRMAWTIAVIAILVAAAAASAAWSRRTIAADPVGLRFEIPLKPATGNHLAVSPDGKYIAFVEEQSGPLLLRAMNSTTPIALTGTTGATNPFWSPDGRFIAYGAGSRLMKIDISGGPPEEFGPPVTDATRRGITGTWSPDGTVLMQVATSGDPGLIAFSASKAAATPAHPLPKPAGVRAMLLPSFLPDGRHFLFVGLSDDATQSGIWVSGPDGQDRKRLSADISKAVYSLGHILFVRDGTLMARPFDAARLEFTGEAIRLLDGVVWNRVNGRASMDANAKGTLAYRTGASTTQDHRLTWIDRSGKTLSTIGPPGEAVGVALSPDGRTVAAHVHRQNGGDLWLIDADGGRSTRLTFDESRDNSAPVWSPDGNEIAFSARLESKWAIFVKPVEGTERLRAQSRDAPMSPMSWSAKDNALIYMGNDPNTGWDLWTLSMTTGTMTPLLTRAFRDGFGQLSPDGRWLAYGSNESGRGETYVESFPPGSFKRQVSYEGGDFPRWRADGAELFFFDRDSGSGLRTMMATAVQAKGSSLDFGRPQPLFSSAVLNGPVQGHLGNYHPYVVSPDGQRFLVAVATGGQAGNTESPAVTVAVNWTADLPKRDP